MVDETIDEIGEEADGTEPEWPVTIKLHKPIKGRDGEMIEEIVLREPTLNLLRCGDKISGPVARTIQIIATLSGLPARVVGELGPRDFARISDQVGEDAFFASGGD